MYPPNPAKLAVDVPKFAHFVRDSGAKVALTTRVYKRMVTLSALKQQWPKNLR